jgi:hypothetical protein
VVYETLFQLIQYAPSTDEVLQTLSSPAVDQPFLHPRPHARKASLNGRSTGRHPVHGQLETADETIRDIGMDDYVGRRERRSTSSATCSASKSRQSWLRRRDAMYRDAAHLGKARPKVASATSYRPDRFEDPGDLKCRGDDTLATLQLTAETGCSTG